MSLETMTKLASATVGAGGASSLTFSNVPQDYTDLCIRISCRTSRAADEDGLGVQFNTATTGYTYTGLAADGATPSAISTSYGQLWTCRIQGASPGTNIFSSTELYIPNYSGNMAKVITADSGTEKGGTNAYITLMSVLQTSPAPVTSITLSGLNAPFQQYSTFTLYGIKSATKTAGNSIKATGGNIVFDGTYVYHVFSASGAFASTQSLVADVLSVGGGAGGGWNNAGGGGGGEVDISRNLSIAAGVSKTVTIGAGGATATSTAGAGANGGTSGFSTDAVSLGGGGGGTGDATNSALRSGQTGGSGGGGSLDNGGGSASGSNTNAGSAGFAVGSGPERYAGGGGGGATSAAVNADGSSRVSGAGGQGYALANIFSGLTLGNITHFGSGGSGGIYVNGNSGLAAAAGTNAGRGGQQSTTGNVNPTEATPNAGGGGGGGSYTGVNSRQGSNGGSGIVIVRYKG